MCFRTPPYLCECRQSRIIRRSHTSDGTCAECGGITKFPSLPLIEPPTPTEPGGDPGDDPLTPRFDPSSPAA